MPTRLTSEANKRYSNVLGNPKSSPEDKKRALDENDRTYHVWYDLDRANRELAARGRGPGGAALTPAPTAQGLRDARGGSGVERQGH